METLNVVSGKTEAGVANFVIVDPEKKIVKRITPIDNSFTVNTNIKALDEESASVNTEILKNFLVGKGLQVTRRGKNWLRCRDYKMRYHSHGFQILDELDFSKPVNINEFNNDFETPESVYNFLVKPDNRLKKEIKLPDPEVEEEKKKAINKLSKKFKVKEEKPEPVKVEKTFERDPKKLTKTLTKIIEKYKSKKIDMEELKKALIATSDVRSIKVMTGKLVRLLENKKMRITAFEKELIKLFVTFDYSSANKKPAPKFIGLQLEEPLSLIRLNDSINYTLKSSSGGTYNVECSEALFLSKLVLCHYPKAMQLIMRIVNGETFDLVKLAETKYKIKDPYIEYDPKEIEKSTNKEHIVEVCEEILSWLQVPNPIYYAYKTDLKKGDKVKVYWGDFDYKWFYGVVLSTDTGVKIRYEDGDVRYLKANQKYKLLK